MKFMIKQRLHFGLSLILNNFRYNEKLWLANDCIIYLKWEVMVGNSSCNKLLFMVKYTRNQFHRAPTYVYSIFDTLG